MGITIEQYLATRQPCTVCNDEGTQDYCITHMLSRDDNCLFYNAIILNSDPYDNADVLLLQNLRSSISGEKVLEYYYRSEPLVKLFKRQHGNNSEFWTGIYNRFIREILTEIRANNRTQVVTLIFNMLDTLEAENAESLNQ
jgi:hypothetical protein